MELVVEEGNPAKKVQDDGRNITNFYAACGR